MSKYSNEFKLMIIKEYLSGTIGQAALTKKYKIATFALLARWHDEYLVTGSIGATGHRIYSPEFEMVVLNYLETHSHSETARHFAVFPSTTIGNWLSAYRKFGHQVGTAMG
ncbi:transposase [Leuconostoc mesenteroides]|uniref:transposase n=1 Tax=Leuconostoc mesenteroides TaxID=1245 RepID=UPI001CBE1518|nr:transposase [Leuconostoc mesenteroides]